MVNHNEFRILKWLQDLNPAAIQLWYKQVQQNARAVDQPACFFGFSSVGSVSSMSFSGVP